MTSSELKLWLCLRFWSWFRFLRSSENAQRSKPFHAAVPIRPLTTMRNEPARKALYEPVSSFIRPLSQGSAQAHAQEAKRKVLPADDHHFALLSFASLSSFVQTAGRESLKYLFSAPLWH